MMVDFSKIADKVKDVDKIKISDIKKETEMKVKMIENKEIKKINEDDVIFQW